MKTDRLISSGVEQKSHQVLSIVVPRDIAKSMKVEGKRQGFLLNRVWLDAAREYLQNRDEGNHDKA